MTMFEIKRILNATRGDHCEKPAVGDGSKSQRLQRQSAAALGLGVKFRDRLRDGTPSPQMVVIPPDAFLMGSPENEPYRRDYERQRKVTLHKAFAIGRCAVTFDEYEAFCRQMGRDTPYDHLWGRGRRPVINVNWFDAMDYCQWLSEQSAQRYRLPSEAEWEYACRAGTTTPFNFGATISTDQANYDGEEGYDTGPKGFYRKQTMEVGLFKPNAWGVHDMHGNVWEWTGSVWAEHDSDAAQRLKPKSIAEDTRYVLRGGSWDSKPQWLRSADRNWTDASFKFNFLGFRLARSL